MNNKLPVRTVMTWFAAVNLQPSTRFLLFLLLKLQKSLQTPPIAMKAYYLKGVHKNQIGLIDISREIVPYLGVVIVTMVLMYQFPGIALWWMMPLYWARLALATWRQLA